MNNDEQLQRDIETNRCDEKSVDAKAYRTIFDVLKKDQYELPYGFADRVIRQLEARKQESSNDYVWLGVGLSFLLVASVATFIFLNIKLTLDLGAFKFLSGYGGLILFSLFLIGAFHLIDKLVVQKR